jgi:hypothetical protein
MKKPACNALSNLFDYFREQDNIELGELLKFHDSFRESLQILRGHTISYLGPLALEHSEGFADEEDLLCKMHREV